MAIKIYISPSDQTNNAYAAGSTNEAEQCRKIGKYTQAALQRCSFTAYCNTTSSMYARIRESNELDVDLHLCIHTNAFNKKVAGTRIFVWDKGGEGYKIAKAIFDELAPLTPGESEGISENRTWAEIKNTNAICVYIEVDFHDVASVAKWIKEHTKDIGEAIAEGLCNYYGVKYKKEETVATKTYKPRLSTPSSTNKWFYKNNPFYQSGYGLPNCTAYAWGRFGELLGIKPKLSTSNAENWWARSDGYKRGQTPKLGAVICWRKGQAGNGSDGAGHVAIVERIYADGSILIGQSGWGASRKFWTQRLYPPYSLGGSYRLQGFIYNPAVTTSSPIVKTGKEYTLQTALKVRTGPGSGYRQKKRSELTADGKKHAKTGVYAVLKKGTKVNVLEVKGNWARIPSGWILAKTLSNKMYIK